MSDLIEIALEGIEFFAYHGYYEEERVKGNTFTADVKVSLPFKGGDTEDIHNTINYEVLYKLTAEEMAKPSLLLETIAANLLDKLFNQYSHLLSAEVSIAKHNPPIEGTCKQSKVTIKRKRQ